MWNDLFEGSRTMTITARSLRILWTLSLLCLVAMSFGFIKDKPEGAKFAPNQTEEEVAAQQAHQATLSEQNAIDYEGQAEGTPEGTSESDAAAALQSAEQARDSQKESDEEAKRVLAVAQKAQSAGPSGGFSWTWILFGALGFGVVLGVRSYANRVVPAMPESTAKTSRPPADQTQPKKYTW